MSDPKRPFLTFRTFRTWLGKGFAMVRARPRSSLQGARLMSDPKRERGVFWTFRTCRPPARMTSQIEHANLHQPTRQSFNDNRHPPRARLGCHPAKGRSPSLNAC